MDQNSRHKVVNKIPLHYPYFQEVRHEKPRNEIRSLNKRKEFRRLHPYNKMGGVTKQSNLNPEHPILDYPLSCAGEVRHVTEQT